MKCAIPVLLAALTTTISMAANARTIENFNSRKGVPTHLVKAKLQTQCWSFHHFDINNNGWNPGMEGDGAMVAASDALNFSNSGLFTPLLNVDQELKVSFDYTFNEKFKNTDRRWLKIILADAANETVQVLEKIEFDAGSATRKHKYNTQFSNLKPGEYRLVFQYGGTGGTARLAIDQLDASASMAHPGGCSLAPTATTLKITGTPDRNATGSLLTRSDMSTLAAYLVKASPDGTVTINKAGTFHFEPNREFKGRSTSFVYRLCDEGSSSLCSENATVHIAFPETPSVAANSLVDFKGAYRNRGNVELAWTTIHKHATTRFELERSLDGLHWVSAGSVSANNDETGSNAYAYTDKLSKSIAHTKDLYYRLKQISAEGQAFISRMLIVRVYNTRTLTMISVTPNPAKNDIAVNVQLLEHCFVSMRVINSEGVPVIFKTAEVEKGENTLLIPGTSKLQPGPYTLEVIVNSKDHMLVKLVKE